MTALIYIRVSTQEQADRGLSLGLQQERCLAYAKMKELEMCSDGGIYCDAGVSGGTPLQDRMEGSSVLERTRGRKPAVTHVIALKLDRLFRNAADALVTTDSWTKHGVSLHLVDMGGAAVDTSSPIGRMFLTMMAGFAEFELATIKGRCKAGLDAKRASGGYCGGRPPYGKRIFRGQLQDVPREIEVLKMIRQLHREGHGYSIIAGILDSSGLLPRSGRRWHRKTIQRLSKRIEESAA